MKTNPKQHTAIMAASITAAVFTASVVSASAQRSTTQVSNQLIPATPNGWLSAYPTVVQTGTKPTLTWSITHPSNIANYTRIDYPGTLTTTQNQLDVDIRVIGAGVTVGDSSGSNTNWVHTQALISVNGGEYKSVFMGTNTDVDPNALVWAQRVNQDTTIRFGGRYYFDGWSETYNSDSSSKNVHILRNGQFPPTAYPLHKSDTVKSFMAPYLDAEGRVKIGPLDAIVLMELTQPDSNTNSPFYNLQDMALLVTARPKGNNGHGNNIDGVDASNPGNAPFAKYDTDASVDDERK